MDIFESSDVVSERKSGKEVSLIEKEDFNVKSFVPKWSPIAAVVALSNVIFYTTLYYNQ